MKLQSDNNTQGNKGHKVKQEYADFKQSHARIVNGIESLNRQTEPLTVHTVDPFVGQHEKQKPPNKQADIDHSTPKQRISNKIDLHIHTFPNIYAMQDILLQV
ncbi:MAG: hypothetical protein JMN27_16790 [gamma proteobacterium endosymbiont of Lamellibrachia anaximandri]|nr:hypothetical protein [gamma proteobacterium endosymbiont of Lamellibrachia anaximandri]MBL3535463.1 hypothetical protein [gamma proteobacterium endosymbiont of Lamellibrachia anaximandri]